MTHLDLGCRCGTEHDSTLDHIEVSSLGACWHCGVLMHFIDLSFEARLHPSECSFVKYQEYIEAQRAAGPTDLSGPWEAGGARR